ncbi:MAG: GNAT family N-acetyltransferase [Rubrivivax sp.]|nr:GNAT family N-acetyltransferase [Rubrivivax sp.]
MKITRIRASELDAPLVARWRELTDANPDLASPYFSVEYTQAAARVRGDVFVSILEHDGRVQGFFPHQSVSRAVAGPVGGRLSDCHGLVCAAGLDWNALDVVRGSGFSIWDFDHVPASQAAFLPHATLHEVSPVMDVSGGYGAYLEQRKAAGAQRIAQMQRKARKFEREVGPMRFEADCKDPRAFAQVVQWKREQCARTGVPDFLSWGWTTALLEQIGATDTPGFAGRLSVLWHGDVVLAAHFGMRSATVWHWWFPTYNDAFSDHSPGGILLLKVAEAAAAAGMRHVDLGKGEDAYKRSFATHSLPLLEGSVLVPSLASRWRRMRTSSVAFARNSPMLTPARAALRQVKGWVGAKPAQSPAAGS